MTLSEKRSLERFVSLRIYRALVMLIIKRTEFMLWRGDVKDGGPGSEAVFAVPFWFQNFRRVMRVFVCIVQGNYITISLYHYITIWLYHYILISLYIYMNIWTYNYIYPWYNTANTHAIQTAFRSFLRSSLFSRQSTWPLVQSFINFSV